MNFTEAEEYLFNIPRFTTKNEPEKTREFLEELGDFSKDIPTVHVAGTNGKGSVCAYLRAGLNACGQTVGLFTSPHLVNTRERFMIDGEMISEREFVNVFEYVMESLKLFRQKNGNREYHPTFFEYLFFMAAVWFKSKRPDFIVLETGLGGRLDATNAIASPVLCAITEIGLDHCEYLGDTKEKIAFEKAGIIKTGVPVVYVNRKEGYEGVIERKAKECDARYYSVSKDIIKSFESKGSGIDFLAYSLYDEIAKISLNTRALYQIENACVAYRALEVLSESFPEKIDVNTAVKGFESMTWPGRFETLKSGVIIDGAHNEDGIKAFLNTVKAQKDDRRVLLYSAVSDKDVNLVSKLIIDSNLFDWFYVCVLDSYRAMGLDGLKEAFKSAKNVKFYESVKEGYGEMVRENSGNLAMFAAGSLYLVGELKALTGEFYD